MNPYEQQKKKKIAQMFVNCPILIEYVSHNHMRYSIHPIPEFIRTFLPTDIVIRNGSGIHNAQEDHHEGSASLKNNTACMRLVPLL